jgi:acyl transferase domain-containing protein
MQGGAVTESRDEGPDGIAIVGMAGRFPGAATLEELWRNLRDGVESIGPLTDEDLAEAGVPPDLAARRDYVRRSPFLDGVELFDAELFGFNPGEAALLDPQHRIFLECSWQALEDAGYDPLRYSGWIGLYAGAAQSAYRLVNLRGEGEVADPLRSLQLQLATDKDHLATRVAYKLNLRGPCLTVQTACSSSLVAVDLARQSLLSYSCDMALAGGVAISLPQRAGYLFQEGGVLSADGRCRPFDARATGTLFGGGAGVVVLKRLRDALAAGDHVRAVIRGSAVNNDGAVKVGYTAPGVDGQARVIAMAQAVAGVDPETITYVEAHGTGTLLGDQIEIEALTQAFRSGTTRRGYCAIGSVKANFGHLETAAGVAGLIKTVLALEHSEIPPSLHCERPNPQIDFEASPFFVNTALRPWKRGTSPRRAGVSSFGMGGTNAHLVLEEAPLALATTPSRPSQLLLLSARTPSALERVAGQLASHLESRPEESLADVAFTLQIGRHPLACRRAVLCGDRQEALRALRDPALSITGYSVAQRSAIFLFPGQGSLAWRPIAALYEAEPEFRAEFDRYSAMFVARLGFDPRTVLATAEPNDGGAAPSSLRTDHAQATLFTVETSLAQVLIRWGVKPAAMIGHSLGECSAACVAGVFAPADAVELVAARGRLMASLPPGGMLAVELPEDGLRPFLTAGLDLAAVNGPRQCIVAGTLEEVAELQSLLKGRGVRCTRLATAHAFHSRMVEPTLDRFRQVLEGVELRRPRLPFVSNVTGDWITEAEATSPEYWVRHLRQTVRFGAGLEALLRSAEGPLVEIGPGRVLSGLVREPAAAQGRAVLSTFLPPGSAESAERFLFHTLGRLWVEGVELDGEGLYAAEKRRRLPLPTYPFERQRHWIEPPHSRIRSASRSEEAMPSAEPLEAHELAESSRDLHARPSLATPYREPRSETETRLAEIWSEVLGVGGVGADDNFFDMGGHSLLAIQLAGRVREALAVEMFLGTLSQAPTIASLAQWIDRRRQQEQQRELGEVLALLGQLSDEEAEEELRRRRTPGLEATSVER